MSIFFKIFISISLSTIISITIFINYIINIKKDEGQKNLNNKIEYHKNINESTISNLLFDLNKDILVKNLNSLYLDDDIAKIELIDFSSIINLKLDEKKLEKPYIKSSINLSIEGEQLGTLHIYYSKNRINESIEDFKLNIYEISVFLVLLLLGIIYYFIKQSVKSIEKLTLATNEISSGNLSFDINIKTNDEIGHLASKFDEMRTSLKNRLHIINQQLKFQQSLIQSINIPIYIKDTKGKYVDCNDAFSNFYGKKREDVIGKSLKNISRKNNIDYYHNLDKQLFDEGGDQTIETQIINNKNESREIILYKNIFNDEDTNLKWMIGTYFDITEINKAKKEIENFNKQLQQMVYDRTEELEEANEELQVTINNLKQTQNQLIESEKLAGLGSLVAGVAHEINTPVGIGLTGITHLLEETNKINNLYKEEKMSQDDFEHYLSVSNELSNLINTNLSRTAQLVKSFKQISFDQTSEEKREFKLIEYVHEILFSISNITKKKNLHIDIISEEEIKINSYPGAFSQILTNLIINSINHAFTKEHTNKKIVLKFIKHEKHVEFIYEDNGKGIKEENLEKIFDPFFTTNRKKGNTGLGLNILYNIITQTLNGTIKCKSKENEGVKFIITLEA